MKKVHMDIINEILVNGLADLSSLGFYTAKNITKLFINRPFGSDSMVVSSTVKASSKLPTVEYENYLTCDFDFMNAFVKVKTSILALKGTVIFESTDSDNKYMIGKIGSGFMNLNPSVLCVDFSNLESESKIYIAAYAKEGLIKQNTAPKAFEMIAEKMK